MKLNLKKPSTVLLDQTNVVMTDFGTQFDLKKNELKYKNATDELTFTI